jgi:hypothetical protein
MLTNTKPAESYLLVDNDEVRLGKARLVYKDVTR